MQAARAETSHATEFDFLIVNDDFGAALADLHAIIRQGSPRSAMGKTTEAAKFWQNCLKLDRMVCSARVRRDLGTTMRF